MLQLRSKSEALVREPEDTISVPKELRQQLAKIRTAFMKFKKRQSELWKQRKETSKKADQLGSSVYNNITIFTHNAISNNIKIVNDKEKAKKDAKIAQKDNSIDDTIDTEALKAELERYKKRTQELQAELEAVKSKLKLHE